MRVMIWPDLVARKHPQKKKDQLALAQVVISLRTGPIPTAPGGWGLRNPEPKGPGQRSGYLFAIQRGQSLDGNGAAL